jgi:hypothetical protein
MGWFGDDVIRTCVSRYSRIPELVSHAFLSNDVDEIEPC